MIALIMAGGVGTRFWPLSRKKMPKQYLSITNESSMIQNTVERLKAKIDIKDIYVVTSADQKALVLDQLEDMPEENVIIEPFGRNTAPCIGLSIQYLLRKYDDNEQLLVLPADHLIPDITSFWNFIENGEDVARDNYLVTFGIKPIYPATGYGYIESEKVFNEKSFHVKQFKEKPDLEKAKEFIKSGNYFWNSGMFLWKLNKINQEFATHLPTMQNLLLKINQRWNENSTTCDISDIYEKMPKIPVDIGIMEQSSTRVVVPVDYDWNDVGGWKALYEVQEKDELNNSINCEFFNIDSENNYINSKKFVAMIGVEDLVFVETDDAILLSKTDRTEDVKKVVEFLTKNKEELV